MTSLQQAHKTQRWRDASWRHRKQKERAAACTWSMEAGWQAVGTATVLINTHCHLRSSVLPGAATFQDERPSIKAADAGSKRSKRNGGCKGEWQHLSGHTFVRSSTRGEGNARVQCVIYVVLWNFCCNWCNSLQKSTLNGGWFKALRCNYGYWSAMQHYIQYTPLVNSFSD